MNVTGKWSAPKSLDIRQGREDLESLAPNLPSRASQRPFLTAAASETASQALRWHFQR